MDARSTRGRSPEVRFQLLLVVPGDPEADRALRGDLVLVGQHPAQELLPAVRAALLG